MTTDVSTNAPGSVRELIGELAQLEDAVRGARISVSSPGGTEPVLNRQVQELLKRQAEVVAALRARRTPAV